MIVTTNSVYKHQVMVMMIFDVNYPDAISRSLTRSSYSGHLVDADATAAWLMSSVISYHLSLLHDSLVLEFITHQLQSPSRRRDLALPHQYDSGETNLFKNGSHASPPIIILPS
jgi:hypothetical protein